MLYRQVAKILGNFLYGFGFTILVPLALSLYYHFYPELDIIDTAADVMAFSLTTVICFALAYLLTYIGKGTSATIFRREGLAAVVIIWFITPAIGALPFLISGTLQNPFQAYFEATSGLTTTGSTVLSAKRFDPVTHVEIPYRQVIPGVISTEYVFYGNVNPLRNPDGIIIREGIEAVSKPLLFWRSFLQWLGGAGIVVLYVAVLPVLGVGGKIMFYTEMTGPVKETLTPRFKETALVLWKIYIGLTLLEIICLYFADPLMPLFDNIATTFANVSTGGLSVRNSSIGSYNNPNVDWVVTLFMIVGGTNFTLYYYCIKGKFYRLYDLELMVYLSLIFISSCFVTWMIIGTPKVLLTTGEPSGVYSISEAIRYAFFHVASAQTSTGFAAIDYDYWPYPTQALLLTLIYIGGMAGSTSAGLKVIRLIMLFRIAQNKIESLYQSERIRIFKIGHNEVTNNVTIGVLCLFLTIIAISVLGVFLLTLDGIDPQSALSIVASSVNGSGFGFREVNPLNSNAFLSNFSLTITSMWMILGRLEFFAVLVILIPSFWRQE